LLEGYAPAPTRPAFASLSNGRTARASAEEPVA
jgi:hypothetical protein